jgi:hypothetical protein
VRRHEFAVMGAAVNLAARLMASKENRGILVDEAIRQQADQRFAFQSLPPVQAKGYDQPVVIFEPSYAATGNKKKKGNFPFIGRKVELDTILGIASGILDASSMTQSTMVFLMAESGMGKSALGVEAIEQVKKREALSEEHSRTVLAARSNSTETEQRIPLR